MKKGRSRRQGWHQPAFSSCLQCEYCMSRRENLCESAEITGETVQGGYAEYISAVEEFVTPIPDNFDSAHCSTFLPRHNCIQGSQGKRACGWQDSWHL